ncbi:MULTISPECIES: patatin-like phospholipase family protein [Flavobacterium]|uniref:Patatin-like phospholipase family protein n=1 Tax=Flavobacterium jumunjinense TaxID=998845 RepID=A0ABV5GIU9_9FLAO|nr:MULTISPECIES: patatin-like phospholipase family protein [Flavobacterium]
MKKTFLLLSLFLFFQISLAQEDSVQKTRPKVGLVLSGGGAKGLAHIGVLKVIDSMGIKIDYIGGTSMGAIIGGLYASGYSAKELDSIFTTLDVDALLQDFTPRDSKSFYEKRNDEMYALTLPFDKFKVGLPSGLSKGLYNFNLLSRLTMSVNNIHDFNDLPIPFFCIATNIENGKEVVLDKGILPQAMIASGAIPTLYNPIEINGKVLVDGGVVNNYPVELVRKMGADIVIGVDVQDGLKNREQLQEATDLLVQVSNFSMIEKMEAKRKVTDIYIKPDIRGYNVVSFEKGKEIIPKGVSAALKFSAELKELVVQKSANNKKDNPREVLNIKEINVNDLENYTRAYVLGKLKFKPESKISFETLEKGINNLNATQNFSSIVYSFQKNGDGEDVIFNLKEKRSNMFLKFGLHYDDLFKSGVLINFTKKKLLKRNDVLSLDVVLGDNFRYNIDYYIDNGFYWSFGIKSKYSYFSKNVPNDFNNGFTLSSLGINSLNVNYSDLSNQVYLQTIFAQKFSIGTGVELKHLKIDSPTLQNIRPIFDNSDYFSIYGYMKFDSFNQKYFPKKGWYFNGEVKTYLYSSDYNNEFDEFTMAKADMGIAYTFLNKITFKLLAEGGFSIGENRANYLDFALGGYGFAPINNLRPFYGYDFVGLIGDSYVKGTFELDYEFYKKHHVNFNGNYANIGYAIFESLEGWFSKPNYSGYAFGYGYDSLIGPLEIKHSWSPETGDHHTWFTVGFWF